MLRPDIVRPKNFAGKMLEIHGYDQIASSVKRGRQHMAIVFIRERQIIYYSFITDDDGIARSPVHLSASSFQPAHLKVGTELAYGGNPFSVNLLRPFGLI